LFTSIPVPVLVGTVGVEGFVDPDRFELDFVDVLELLGLDYDDIIDFDGFDLLDVETTTFGPDLVLTFEEVVDFVPVDLVAVGLLD
jgi:hypothetical protein